MKLANTGLKRIALIAIAISLIWFWNCLPDPLFDREPGQLVESAEGDILSARIAKDGQWRFLSADTLPMKYKTALLEFEDRHFYRHPGVNPLALGRALIQNIRSGRIVSGGSTITMQVIRMARGNKRRSVWNKFIETVMALRLELTSSKKQILSLYATHAPFGGNIVGLEAASLKYFGRSPSRLSWSESALLAVLPNAPSLIYPGKNQVTLIAKRNSLLNRLQNRGIIDSESCELAKSEHAPDRIFDMPRNAPHLLQRIAETPLGPRVRSSIQSELQNRVTSLVDRQHRLLHENQVHNMSVIVGDVRTGAIVAYVGNTDCPLEGSGRDVDVILAPRSTGSLLKPFLYHDAIADGHILPQALLPDVPTNFGGYQPTNFNEKFDGAVPADETLSRSLNIPAVRLLKSYGVEKFHGNMQLRNQRHIDRAPDHYGLSYILGGAESNLNDLSMAYANMSREMQGMASMYSWQIESGIRADTVIEEVYDKGALWWTLEALRRLERPLGETGWKLFSGTRKVAWKTGTSFGHRDAWAIGITPDHVVGVWVGNADGEGRPGLTGVQVAAPLMFDVFRELPQSGWFEKPHSDLQAVDVCALSGFLAGPNCDSVSVKSFPDQAERSDPCSYHTIAHLDESETYRVNSGCYPVSRMTKRNYFQLPPIMEWYYVRRSPAYEVLPKVLPGCNTDLTNVLSFIYPENGSQVVIPREFTGVKGRMVAKLATRNSANITYWYLDHQYIGQTTNIHEIDVLPSPGWHTLAVVDELGNSSEVRFEVLE